MSFINKLNYKADGHLVVDELFTLQPSKVYTLKHHNLINNEQLEVWTFAERTGTQITDFTISQNAQKSWMYNVAFGETVSVGDYYVTYYSQGDENDADDINLIQQEIDIIKASPSVTSGSRLVASYTYVPEWQLSGTDISIDIATDTLTAVNHGLIDGNIVVFSVQRLESTAIPTGFIVSKTYYVRMATQDTFKLSNDNTDTGIVNITSASGVTGGLWRLEKVGTMRSFTFTNLNIKNARIIAKNGGVMLTVGSLNFTVNGVGESDSYHYQHPSAQGVGTQLYLYYWGANPTYISKATFITDIICSNGNINAICFTQNGSANTTSNNPQRGYGTGAGFSKYDERFDMIRELSFNFGAGYVTGDFTLEVWEV